MGKKRSSKDRTAMPGNVRCLLNETVAELLKKCTSSVNGNSKQLLQEFQYVAKLINKIQDLEDGYGKFGSVDRRKEWDNFVSWADAKGINHESVYLCKCDDSDEYGLKAKRDIKENDLMLKVPREAMMTVDEAMNTKLGPLIKADPILQHMPNVVLTLFLLFELSNSSSPFLPYLKILPSKYKTVLYFSANDLELLKSSPVLDEALKLNFSIARQYAYFYRIFNNDPVYKHWPLRDIFTYNNYRWAASTVMTRQNSIPSSDRKSMVTALIPMWDMCNHVEGKISTDYNDEQDTCECYSFKDFSKDSQVFIYYGRRTNAQFLLHNGFVYAENRNDGIDIKLGISVADSLYDSKCQLLQQHQVSLSGSFPLRTKGNTQEDSTLLFLSVFLMTKDQVDRALECGVKEIADQLEDKITDFLKIRTSLLLKSYETSLQDDEDKLKTKLLTEHETSILQLKICEKRILWSHAAEKI